MCNLEIEISCHSPVRKDDGPFMILWVLVILYLILFMTIGSMINQGYLFLQNDPNMLPWCQFQCSMLPLANHYPIGLYINSLLSD